MLAFFAFTIAAIVALTARRFTRDVATLLPVFIFGGLAAVATMSGHTSLGENLALVAVLVVIVFALRPLFHVRAFARRKRGW
jgi:NhaP-type Na+/H+ or K+/H+ antiporter